MTVHVSSVRGNSTLSIIDNRVSTRTSHIRHYQYGIYMYTNDIRSDSYITVQGNQFAVGSIGVPDLSTNPWPMFFQINQLIDSLIDISFNSFSVDNHTRQSCIHFVGGNLRSSWQLLVRNNTARCTRAFFEEVLSVSSITDSDFAFVGNHITLLRPEATTYIFRQSGAPFNRTGYRIWHRCNNISRWNASIQAFDDNLPFNSVWGNFTVFADPRGLPCADCKVTIDCNRLLLDTSAAQMVFYNWSSSSPYGICQCHCFQPIEPFYQQLGDYTSTCTPVLKVPVAVGGSVALPTTSPRPLPLRTLTRTADHPFPLSTTATIDAVDESMSHTLPRRSTATERTNRRVSKTSVVEPTIPETLQPTSVPPPQRTLPTAHSTTSTTHSIVAEMEEPTPTYTTPKDTFRQVSKTLSLPVRAPKPPVPPQAIATVGMTATVALAGAAAGGGAAAAELQALAVVGLLDCVRYS